MPQDPEATLAQHLETETRSALLPSGPAVQKLVPGLTVLCHPEVARIGERAALAELASGQAVTLSRLEPLFSAAGSTERRPLADPFVSRKPLRLSPGAAGAVRVENVAAHRLIKVGGGAASGDAQDELISADQLHRGLIIVMAERVALLFHLMVPSLPPYPRFGMVGESHGTLEVRRQIAQSTDLDAAALILGETGTGKELVARALHGAGTRSAGPFVALNMGAVAPNLVTAELFGVAKGAFTGADRQRPGHFVEAHGGVLFLDEIGEAPVEAQVALLRTLETGEVRPVGGGPVRNVDVRVVAATDADLETLLAEGSFRKALRHRLSACEIAVPPLRERREDIGSLFLHFLRQELDSVGCGDRLAAPREDTRPWFGAELMARLALAPWPGNVRQLRNVARQLVASCRQEQEAWLTPQIEHQLQPVGIDESPGPDLADATEPNSRRSYRRPEEVGEQELLQVLTSNRYRLQPTAAELGISRASLYRLMDRFPSVRKPVDLEPAEIVACAERCGGDLEAMVDELRVSRKGLRRRMTQLNLS